MKRIAITLILTVVLAGCSAKADSRTSFDTFDESLADFQKHLQTCLYPAGHIMAFAKSWNVPEFVIQAYVPPGVNYAKGKTNQTQNSD